jgi:isoquinoline 1-oxidoreductase beta subunit
MLKLADLAAARITAPVAADPIASNAAADPAAAVLGRRAFIAVTSLGGVAGLALLAPAARGQQPGAAPPPPGSKPTEQPAAFVAIDADGAVTVLVNRMDMGQAISTALPMVLAEELDVDWARVQPRFGNEQPAYADPLMGLHLTGGSNSIKNSYLQYRELGARTRAMLLAAAAARWGVPAAELSTRAGRVLGPGGRSAGYGELFADALKQPVPERVALKDPKQFRLIGKPTARQNARAIASGRQDYGIDLKLPGLRTALIARPPVWGGKVKALDDGAALKVAGVRAVLRVPLDRGGEGVAVVADGYWPAKLGRDALKVDWDLAAAPGRVDSARQREDYARLLEAGAPELFAAPAEPHFNADLGDRLAKAPRKLVAQFAFPYLNHAQMEPLACTVDFEPGQRCEVYTASQMPGIDAQAVARLTGLKPEQVRIHVQMAGGGFGRRATISSDYISDATQVARALASAGQRAPVKLIYSREDDLRAGYYRPMTMHRAEIGYDDAGTILAWEHRIVSQSIVAGTPFAAFMIKNGVDATTTEGMGEPYALPLRLRVHHPQLNVPVLWWRSVGSTHTAYVMETLVDEIARATRQDPVAYRKKLMAGKAPRHVAALDLAVAKSGYGSRRLAPGRAFGVAVHESFQSVVAYVVEASLGADGRPKLHAVTAGVHCNFCVNPLTVEAQVQGAALMALATTLPGHAITLKDGQVEQSNFHDFPPLRIGDAPPVAVHIVPSSDAPTGMGEPGLPPLAPALANAIAALTGGAAPRELPFKLG